jgi:hypothetical protein
MYTPKYPPINPDVRSLADYAVNELQSVAQAQADPRDFFQLNVLNVAPKKPRAGMVVEADGTNWNPGSGAGCYIYRASAWVKLG